jgi:hypothetical protein
MVVELYGRIVAAEKRIRGPRGHKPNLIPAFPLNHYPRIPGIKSTAII